MPTPSKRFQLLNPHAREALEFTNAVERAGRALVAARRGMSYAHGLRVCGWRVLKAASRSKSPASIAGIARRLGLTRQATHEVVHELSSGGWLLLQRAPRDRRMLILALTPRAVQALASVESAMRALLLEVTRDISRTSLVTATLELAEVSKRLRNCRSIVERYARRTLQADRRSGSPHERRRISSRGAVAGR